VRIGIDVGGTFTHAVAIDGETLALLGKAKVPTTHSAEEGVARGVIDSLMSLLKAQGLAPEDICFIAHSTTQATNALLEGDVATVGIVGMGSGMGAWLARRQTAIKPISLAPGRWLQTVHRFIPSERVNEASVRAAVESLHEAGAGVVVAAEAFAVDDPTNETLVCEVARDLGLPATASHQVSQLHGLGTRTRTAVINASMVPRMLSTAEMTERAVREAGLSAPLMIMRSDGGVMDIDQMRRRPILTMLSGPAAGVAAALLYAQVSDGLFLEVGGTSTDISVIRNGRCLIRSAEVGGQKLHVSTLDVRTVGLAGGSLVYLRDGVIGQVGPRSSHIAGLGYLSFADQGGGPLQASTHTFEGDTFLTVSVGGTPHAVTPTCASNCLGLVPDGDCARGNADLVRRGFACLAHERGLSDGSALAEEIMAKAGERVVSLVHGMMQDYRLDAGLVRLVGGGGGASAVVPYVARTMALAHETVDNADVISAIGVALALVRDSVERTVIDPSEEDIRAIREAAFGSVLRMGANPDTIEVLVEVDAKRNLLRATAEGATEIRTQALRREPLTAEQRLALVRTSLGPIDAAPTVLTTSAGFEVWRAIYRYRRLGGLVRERRQAVRALDERGTVRWASNHADGRATSVGAAENDLDAFAEEYTRYTDAGATIPRCHVLLADRIIDLSGLVTMRQVLDVLRMELKRHASDTSCVLLVDLA
jgi:N-methylhydantoinase A/oxoprolinase/acetone carboxylase beta subunit